MQSTATRIAIDEARIISLPERTDRITKIAHHIHHTPDWPFPRPVITDGIRESAPPWYQSNDGAWGCRQAHLRILTQQWERGIEATLILEDDATWNEHLAERWSMAAANIPHDWDMIMLGGEHIQAPTLVDAHVLRCQNTRRTHAYVIRLKAIPLLARTWRSARRHIDHSNQDFQHQARVYATSPFMFGQDAGRSDISGAHNRDVRYWG